MEPQLPPVDSEGFLQNIEDWTPNVVESIAQKENIDLTPEHWEILFLARKFYQKFDLSPAMRPLVKFIGTHLGKEKGKSIYLMQLFGPSPAKLVAKLAGLPKPANCL